MAISAARPRRTSDDLSAPGWASKLSRKIKVRLHRLSAGQRIAQKTGIDSAIPAATTGSARTNHDRPRTAMSKMATSRKARNRPKPSCTKEL
jgi:hypothetical protein